MPDGQPAPATSERENFAHEGTVLDSLVDGENQRPRAVEELNLEVGDEIIVADANLRAAGLVHKTSDGFVFATRAAIHCHEISAQPDLLGDPSPRFCPSPRPNMVPGCAIP